MHDNDYFVVSAGVSGQFLLAAFLLTFYSRYFSYFRLFSPVMYRS